MHPLIRKLRKLRKIRRMFPRPWMPLLIGVLGLALGTPMALFLAFREPLDVIHPDPFYRPPNPVPPGAAGTLIRREALLEGLPAGAVGWRIMYRSTGIEGEPRAVTGVVLAPEIPSLTPRPIIAWAPGILGLIPGCSPDRAHAQIPAVEAMIREGFVVVATDYGNLGSAAPPPYLVGHITGHALLDSVRAARHMDVGAGRRFALWGASHGGHAAVWAAREAPSHAPELDLVGVATSAPALDLVELFSSSSEDSAHGMFVGQVLRAWSRVYPEAELDTLIEAEHREDLERSSSRCTPERESTPPPVPRPAQYLELDPLKTEPWRSIIRANVPREDLEVPLLIVHGTADPVIPIETSVAEAQRRCANGEDVELVRLPGVGHDAREEASLFVLGWIEDRFAGRNSGPNCGTQPSE